MSEPVSAGGLTMADLDLRGLSADSTYDELYARLMDLNAKAMTTAPSPWWDFYHCCIDLVLVWMGYPEPEDT